ncbi:MAG: class I SAM-dependent methyltransferase [Candidatus Bathyarchaeota archaeon]|jgi:SAM-dependent methyltransferase
MGDMLSTDAGHWKSADHVKKYQSMIKDVPHSKEIPKILLEQIPSNVRNVLDLGSGDGRLLNLVKQKNPKAAGVALDFSDPMLELARKRFENDKSVVIMKHDLSVPLPTGKWEPFDLVLSGLAIHHLEHERKKQLYSEIFNLLASGGIFLNLEHVASSTEALHQQFLASVGIPPEEDDPSNKLLDVETQLKWLREIGFRDVDCFWKWLEVALFGGTKP